MNVESILCVCTGNICRSPLAEGVFRRELPETTVASAGVAAVVGGNMPEPAQAIADREQLRLSDHRGAQIESAHLTDYDLIIVMEHGQRQWLADSYPASRGRIFLLSYWRDNTDIADPYRHDQAFFEQIYTEIEACVTDWTNRLNA